MVRRNSTTITIRGIFDNVETLRQELKKIDLHKVPAYISIDAACDLFKRFIMLAATGAMQSQNIGEALLKAGNKALSQLRNARPKIQDSLRILGFSEFLD